MRGVSGSRTPARTRLPAESPVFGLMAVGSDVGSSFCVAFMTYPVCRRDFVWDWTLESRPRGGMSKPSFESHRADSPGGARRDQRLIVQLGAEIARVNIGRHRARVFAVAQYATDKLVQSKFLGARY